MACDHNKFTKRTQNETTKRQNDRTNERGIRLSFFLFARWKDRNTKNKDKSEIKSHKHHTPQTHVFHLTCAGQERAGERTMKKKSIRRTVLVSHVPLLGRHITNHLFRSTVAGNRDLDDQPNYANPSTSQTERIRETRTQTHTSRTGLRCTEPN